jgi:DNA primase
MKRNEELDQFKTQIDLVDYAQNNGYQLDTKKSSTNCIVLFDDRGDKILVGLDKTDHHYFYYSLTNETDKGSIIDFVQKRKNLNLGEVRKELRPWTNNSNLTNYKLNSKVNNKVTNKSEIKLIPTNQNKYQIIAQFENFQTINNHPYLNQRGINQNTINNPRFQETIYQDKRNNVIFPHSDREGVCGYEIRNQNFKGFSSGGTKGLWVSKSQQNDKKLVICESPLDCLSYHQLFPDAHTRYFATSGTLSEKQKDLLRTAFEKLHQKEGEIIIATDRDGAGEEISQELIKIAPKMAQISRHVPKQKDWNEALKAKIERERQQQNQKRRGRGLSL